jgi:hypothetical protein
VLKPGYRHYNQLVDICFWTLIGLFCWFISQDLGLIPRTLLGQWHPLNLAALVIAGLFKLAMLALVLFSRLRDEYAERLWRQAAGTYAKFMVLMPFLWMLLMILDESWWHVADWLRSHPDASLIPERSRFPGPNSIGIHQLEGINYLLAKIAGYFPLMFAGFYKWHRWRDLGE